MILKDLCWKFKSFLLVYCAFILILHCEINWMEMVYSNQSYWSITGFLFLFFYKFVRVKHTLSLLIGFLNLRYIAHILKTWWMLLTLKIFGKNHQESGCRLRKANHYNLIWVIHFSQHFLILPFMIFQNSIYSHFFSKIPKPSAIHLHYEPYFKENNKPT